MMPPSNLFSIPNGGLAEVAEYNDQPLVEYKGNPLIEALPPILSKEYFVEAVSEYPAFDESEKKLDSWVRLHCVERLLRFFQPLDRHIDLEQKISRVLRQGYLARNPFAPIYATRLSQINKSIKAAREDKTASFAKYVNTPSSASGFTVIGVSGVGKSTAVNRILGLYPQIILHSEYQGTPLNAYQIVWLKLDCPHAGSLKGLCIDFFIAIDKLLGTDYHRKFASRQNSEDSMLARMALVASIHSLGVLVIDEIQDLSTAKSGGSEKMLNFFVKLVNTIGVPVVRIGTNKALPILQGDFRQARRGTGEGGVYWERMMRDTPEEKEIWRFFVEGFFDYQWTRNSVSLNDELDELLHEESQGIVDIAIKLFMIAQWRAIAVESEIITPDLIKQVASDSLHLVRPMLDALKSGDKERIAKYSDIKPLDIKDFYEHFRLKLEVKKQADLEKLRANSLATQSSTGIPSFLREVILQLMSLDLPPALAKLHAEKAVAAREPDATVAELTRKAYETALKEGLIPQEKPEAKEQKAATKQVRSKSYIHGDLRLIVAEAKKNKSSAYQALMNHGVLKPPMQDVLAVKGWA
jgi:NACalpha-BTF3-like transcription factor